MVSAMRRWPTWLVVGALVALGAVAVADALRGGGEEATTVRRTTTVASPLIPPNEPAGSAMSGVLYYSNAKAGCRLAGVILPDLEKARTPQLRSCRFSSSPSGQDVLPGTAAWQPHGGLYARETKGMIELGSPFSHQTLRFPGRAPAFKPDNTFTYVRGSEVVEWTTHCPPGASRFTLTGDNATARCRRVVLSTGEVRRALTAVNASGPLTPKAVAWLSDTRLVTVVGDAGISGHREHLSVIDRRRLVGATIGEFGGGLRVEASPHGNFFTAWYGDSLVTIRDRDGDPISFPPFTRVLAVTWSPDERWTAAATEHSVFVFRTNEGEARIRRLPIEARDLAWR
jgi:hypothetical protein